MSKKSIVIKIEVQEANGMAVTKGVVKQRRDPHKDINGDKNKSYRIIGRGDYLYITEKKHDSGRDARYLASVEQIRRIMQQKDARVEVDVRGLSKIQFGNVMKAFRIIDMKEGAVDVAVEEKDGKRLLVVKTR